jgi:hypothetical protein
MFEQENSAAVRIALAVSMAHFDQPPRDDILQFLTASLLTDNEIEQRYHAQPWDSGEVVEDIIEALCASNRGVRLLISRFNQLLVAGAHNDLLEYIRYALSGKRVEGLNGNDLAGPLRPLTPPYD